jgi:hypothetical protein
MNTVDGYQHEVASHCETGSVRNLLGHAGLEISEPMVFGIGSGPTFYYLFMAKGHNGLPMIGIRNRPGSILKNVAKRCGIEFTQKTFKRSVEARRVAESLLDRGKPVAAIVDMFYMKYLPAYLHVHAPFHTILLVGHEGERYAVSDPYAEEIAELPAEDLDAAWETNAPLSRNNFMAAVDAIPAEIDWRRAVKTSIKKTCGEMLMPAPARLLVPFVGVQGMRMYARKMLEWPDKYRGVQLREGILFSAVGFEDQGTGGGAFRLMYGAFLKEIAQRFDSAEMGELAEQMIDHGTKWRDFSRKLIRVGKLVPQDENAFDEWLRGHRDELRDGLQEASTMFLERVAFEEDFFARLRAAAARL